MTERLLAAVGLRLQAAFGYPVHVQDVAQGLQAPAFLAEVESLEKKQYPGGRCLLQWSLDVRFYPADGADNRTLHAMAGMLTDLLTFVTDPAGRQYYGRGIRCEIQDGVLHTRVTYAASAAAAQTAESMESLSGSLNAAAALLAGGTEADADADGTDDDTMEDLTLSGDQA